MPTPPHIPQMPSVQEDLPFSQAEHDVGEDNQMTIVLEASNGIQAFLDPFTILAAGKLMHSLQAQVSAPFLYVLS
jgi:hypothetical protein